MKIYYITYPSDKPWCSDFTALNLKKHSKNHVTPINKINIKQIHPNSIIHIHNVQILAKNWFPQQLIKKLHDKGCKIITGLRGNRALHKHNHLLKNSDAIAVGVDPSLENYAKQHNKKVYILPPGENPQHFKPDYTTPKTVDLCWVGRDHKNFKNSNLITNLGFTYKQATYHNYIPHDQMPTFYNSSRILVGFSSYEGFWRPCIEAAMCGLPILSTPVGVVPEILDPECIIPQPAYGNLTEYKVKIRNLLNEPDFAIWVGSENRKRALKYSWPNVAKLYDEAWRCINEC